MPWPTVGTRRGQAGACRSLWRRARATSTASSLRPRCCARPSSVESRVSRQSPRVGCPACSGRVRTGSGIGLERTNRRWDNPNRRVISSSRATITGSASRDKTRGCTARRRVHGTDTMFCWTWRRNADGQRKKGFKRQDFSDSQRTLAPFLGDGRFATLAVVGPLSAPPVAKTTEQPSL